ncbi:MAG: 3-phosphoshikimate 1-carboxyvinyltransferase [Elusimicrobia bacterium]|nr:3-phosphoshikimate 1-carboxyvinyltransferase [Elusimicrobiota bacterium]
MPTVSIRPKEKIKTTLNVPGDKSITHRAVILSSLSEGKSTIHNYLDSDDCRRTTGVFRDMGVKIQKFPGGKLSDANLTVEGVGIDGLKQPAGPLDAGNSGTTIRLVSGVVAGQDITCEIFGDESLSGRPMDRIIVPLSEMGSDISAREGKYPPLKIKGNPDLKPIRYALPVASAQVKSCVLLAGMQAEGATVVVDPYHTRDHTERMLAYFGASVKDGGEEKIINGPVKLKAKEIFVPGDISSAAYFVVAGMLVPGSEIEIKNVGLNPLRDGIIKTLLKLGGEIIINNRKDVCNEPVGDIVVRSGRRFSGVTVDEPSLIPSMIDEIPLLVLAATQAEGKTIIRNVAELRVKESDRIKSIATELNKLGARITELPDGFTIEGKTPLKGAGVKSYGDHRIAMTLAVAGLIADGETIIEDPGCVDISFPGFWDVMESI